MAEYPCASASREREIDYQRQSLRDKENFISTICATLKLESNMIMMSEPSREMEELGKGTVLTYA